MIWTDTALATVIVAAITTIGGIVVAVVSRKNDTTKKEEPTLFAPIPESIPIKPEKVFTRVDPVVEKIRQPISDIPHSTMVEHIMRVPPAQRKSIEAHYVGLRVKWLVSLSSVSGLIGGDVAFHAHLASDRVTLECRAKPDDISCLLHLPEGGDFILEGTLKLVSGAYCILEDCITFLPPKK